MEAAPPIARTRFFGLAPDSRAASPAARTAVKRSIARIQPGSAWSCPSRGRSFHCLAPMSRKSTPSTSLSQYVQRAGVPASSAPAPEPARTTAVVITPSVTIQPSVNAVPLTLPRGVASISTTAISGSGLMAMPTADASICPTASPIAASSAPDPVHPRQAGGGPEPSHSPGRPQRGPGRTGEHTAAGVRARGARLRAGLQGMTVGGPTSPCTRSESAWTRRR